MKNIAILASGSGTNAENIINEFKKSNLAQIRVIISNKSDAFVHKRAENYNIASHYIPKKDFEKGDLLLDILKKYEIDFIILAGFLLKIPEYLIEKYPNSIINIHPALLPKYGGKGMYGDNVHKAVVENEESESGITIHYVTKDYDEGTIIFQARCKVEASDTYEDVAKKVHTLEYKHFPSVIEKLIKEF